MNIQGIVSLSEYYENDTFQLLSECSETIRNI